MRLTVPEFNARGNADSFDVLTASIMSAQVPDLIIMNGRKMELYTNPLEQYWIRLNKNRPSFKVAENCKRGYVATWEIKGRRLFLRAIESQVLRRTLFFRKRWKRYTVTSFLKSGGEIIASWFSGKLRIPNGRMTLYKHNGYDSRFEKETIITVDHGNVEKMVTLDNVNQTLTVNHPAAGVREIRR